MKAFIICVVFAGSLVFLAGFTFLFSQGENGEFMSEALLKDSTGYAGYEPVLKTGPFYGDEVCVANIFILMPQQT